MFLNRIQQGMSGGFAAYNNLRVTYLYLEKNYPNEEILMFLEEANNRNLDLEDRLLYFNTFLIMIIEKFPEIGELIERVE